MTDAHGNCRNRHPAELAGNAGERELANPNSVKCGETGLGAT